MIDFDRNILKKVVYFFVYFRNKSHYVHMSDHDPDEKWQQTMIAKASEKVSFYSAQGS